MSNVPVLDSLLPADFARLESLRALYEHRFRSKPEFYVRAPGRANIIGDHVDYSYFSVLPMAIENSIMMAVGVTEAPEITLLNADPKFEETIFSIANNEVEIDATKSDWANYVKSGFIVASRYLDEKNPGQKVGLRIVVSGNVPAGGGLSSSAAMVVASTLVTLVSNGMSEVSKVLLTQLSITCEQLLGMNTGGMDQAASIFGKKDNCLLISFRPELKAEPMQYPQLGEPFAFLVANSWVPAVKHETAPIGYNLRVVEVSVAANILAKKLGVEIPQDGNLQCGTLRGVMEAVKQQVSIETLDEMAEIARKHLSAEDYTRAEAAEALGLSDTEFEAKYLSEFPVRFERLKLLNRTIHVYEEARRVLQFVELMHSGTQLKQFGELMNESHKSAQELYENSHEDVDKLCEIARNAGSVGSRVTGAGFGGCTIHLVPADKLSAVITAIKGDYYANQYPEAPEDALVVTEPGQGATILSLP